MPFFSKCPSCSQLNPLVIPFEIPSTCKACSKTFVPHCSECNHLFPHECTCSVEWERKTNGHHTPRVITKERVALRLSETSDEWEDDTGVYTKPPAPDPAPIVDISITARTITEPIPVIILDTHVKEALIRVLSHSDYQSDIDRDRDCLLTYLIEAMSRIENMLATTPVQNESTKTGT